MRRASDGMASSNAAERKKGRLDLGLGQEVEQTMRVALDPRRQPLPVLAVDGRGKGFDLKIILDVDGHRAGNARAQVAAPAVVPGCRGPTRFWAAGIGGALQRFDCRAHIRSP